MCLAYLILLDLIIVIVVGEEYRYENPRYSVFSNVLSLHPSLLEISPVIMP
jgi:hypothetical protein